MATKILSVLKVAARDVKYGDIFIDRALKNGFGEVEVTGRGADEVGRERVRLLVKRRAFDLDPGQSVEVAHAIVWDGRYCTRVVEKEETIFPEVGALYTNAL